MKMKYLQEFGYFGSIMQHEDIDKHIINRIKNNDRIGEELLKLIIE